MGKSKYYKHGLKIEDYPLSLGIRNLPEPVLNQVIDEIDFSDLNFSINVVLESLAKAIQEKHGQVKKEVETSPLGKISEKSRQKLAAFVPKIVCLLDLVIYRQYSYSILSLSQVLINLNYLCADILFSLAKTAIQTKAKYSSKLAHLRALIKQMKINYRGSFNHG